MRDAHKSGPKLRASSASLSVIIANRSGDVTGFRVGRTRLEGDTRAKDKRVRGFLPSKKPLHQALFDLPARIRGEPLTEAEAFHWAGVMKLRLR